MSALSVKMWLFVSIMAIQKTDKDITELLELDHGVCLK